MHFHVDSLKSIVRNLINILGKNLKPVSISLNPSIFTPLRCLALCNLWRKMTSQIPLNFFVNQSKIAVSPVVPHFGPGMFRHQCSDPTR